MKFEFLNQKQLCEFSAEELHIYLQQLKKYKSFIMEEIIRKRDICDKIVASELLDDNLVLSERNIKIVEELKNKL